MSKRTDSYNYNYNLDNDTLISMMNQLHKINMDNIDPEFSLDIPCPHIVVIGDQGLGKSTTLNRLLGAEILPMRQSTHESSICTLFPTIYHTVFDNEIEDCIIEMWYKKNNEEEQLLDTINIPFDLIKVTVKNKFNKFYNENEKDNNIETLRVIVRGAKLSNKYVIDLPGIRNDKSEQSDKIKNQIIKYLDNNHGALLLFFLPSSGPERTSAWSIINKYLNTSHTIIPILIKPDELGTNDSTIIKILIGKTDIKFPSENIFVIKNPNTLNNETFDIKKAGLDELNWFENHPIYSKYINEVPLNKKLDKKFGFDKLINKIIQILNAKYHAIIPKITEVAENKMHSYMQQKKLLKEKLVIQDSNKLLIYKRYVDEFLKKIRDIINGEITNDELSGSIIKLKIKEFYNTANSITYIGNFKMKEINTIILQCGGSRDLYTKFREEVLINMLFRDEKSPAKQLEILMIKYIEAIVKLFKDIIFKVNFPNNQLDQQFWINLKDKLISNIDKNYVINGLNMLSVAQESYFEFEDNKEKDNYKESEKLSEVNMDNVLNTKRIWEKYLFIIKLQFGKYIQKHFIEYNLSEERMDNLYYSQDNIDFLIKFLKEPDDMGKRREQLDKNIEKLRILLEIIGKINNKI